MFGVTEGGETVKDPELRVYNAERPGALYNNTSVRKKVEINSPHGK